MLRLLLLLLLHDLRAQCKPGVDSDYGCNYVNMGGVGMPTDYCMQIAFNGFVVGFKWACNQYWNGVNSEVYTSATCDGDAFLVQPSTEQVEGFYCSEEYQEAECDEVSLNAYDDNECADEDFSEIRLIADKCFWYQDDIYWLIQCTPSSATVFIYESPNGNCTDEYLLNTTKLNEGELDGENAGCIQIEGCSMQSTSTSKNELSLILGYIFMSIVIVALLAAAIALFVRYRHNQKMQQIAAAVSHSGKPVDNPYGQLDEELHQNKNETDTTQKDIVLDDVPKEPRKPAKEDLADDLLETHVETPQDDTGK